MTDEQRAQEHDWKGAAEVAASRIESLEWFSGSPLDDPKDTELQAEMKREMDAMRLLARVASALASGWVLVPNRVTEDMAYAMDLAGQSGESWDAIYIAMLAAAPDLPEGT